jgi:hypothetical protein
MGGGQDDAARVRRLEGLEGNNVPSHLTLLPIPPGGMLGIPPPPRR